VDPAEIKRIAIKSGMKTLHQDALLKVKGGVTSLEEALATAPPDLR
jgi:type IV pilus assembly protein PilB